MRITTRAHRRTGRVCAAFALVVLLLPLTASAVVADNTYPPTDSEIAQVNRWVIPLATSGVVDPIQVAVIESDVLACIGGTFPPLTVSNSNRVIDCEQSSVPIAIYGLLVTAKFYIFGPWATNYGPIIIDKDNKGTLMYTTANGGTSTLQFYGAPSTNDSTPVYTFTYVNTFGDRGYGVLLMSDTGCLLYGQYRSAVNAQSGNYLMARC